MSLSVGARRAGCASLALVGWYLSSCASGASMTTATQCSSGRPSRCSTAATGWYRTSSSVCCGYVDMHSICISEYAHARRCAFPCGGHMRVRIRRARGDNHIRIRSLSRLCSRRSSTGFGSRSRSCRGSRRRGGSRASRSTATIPCCSVCMHRRLACCAIALGFFNTVAQQGTVTPPRILLTS